ncbi:hypothetical protein HPB52_019595 [Rhipicephalus sanguineus]|uniref:Uncharacterized protein n=1 Tax=Rhipicephalus sanguineus TaxID=34632 RepID=A0A9D4PXK3_RHISA|nr:hypothetical protein HPB52_019595 [Rhipicephalus sanguineus]
MGTTSHWRPSQAGLLISTSVVLSLYEELLAKHRYRYVLTGRLVQDCIENIFSVLRLRKPVPTAHDVKCALKLISVGQFSHTPKSTGYEVDDSLYLADLLGPTLKDKPTESEDDDEKLEDLLVDVTDVECDILAYFGGFLDKALLKGSMGTLLLIYALERGRHGFPGQYNVYFGLIGIILVVSMAEPSPWV